MSCDVGEVTESFAHSPTFPSLHLRHNPFSNTSVALPTSQLILQPFLCFTYSQFILQHFFRFYVTSSSLNSPGKPAELILQRFRHFTYVTTHSQTLPSLYLYHSSLSNPSVASPTHSSFSNLSFASLTSQVLHLIHLASRPWPS